MYSIDGTVYVDYGQGCCCPSLVVSRMEIEASRRRPAGSRATEMQESDAQSVNGESGSRIRENFEGYKSHSAMSLPRGLIDASPSSHDSLAATNNSVANRGPPRSLSDGSATSDQHGTSEWTIRDRPALSTIREMSRESSTVTLTLPGPALDVPLHSDVDNPWVKTKDDPNPAESGSQKADATHSKGKETQGPGLLDSSLAKGDVNRPLDNDHDDGKSVTDSIRQARALMCMGQK